MSSSSSSAMKSVMKSTMKSAAVRKSKAAVVTSGSGGGAAASNGGVSSSSSTGRLPPVEKKQLSDSLYFMHVPELRSLLSDTLKIWDRGTKGLMVQRIVHYLDSYNKQILQKPKIPVSATAKGLSEDKKTKISPTNPNHFMVHGVYKNDAVSRAFFKQIIGDHFAFTARGLDWLNEKWMNGITPTYQEFGAYWKSSEKEGHLKKDTLQYNQFQVKFKGKSAEWINSEWDKLREKEKKTALGLVGKWKW